jgi:hypothetical protein
MKKVVTLAVVAALALVVIGPADAKKKKPKKARPVAVQYFLRTAEDCAAPFLSTTDGEDVDCVYGETGFSAVGEAAGRDWSMTYVASDGVPLVLDAAGKVTGAMSVRGWNSAGGIGEAEVDLVLTATIAGEEKEIGTFNHAYTAGPAHVENIEFEMALDPALAGVAVEGLSLNFYSHGLTLGGRGIEHDDATIPTITIPTLK